MRWLVLLLTLLSAPLRAEEVVLGLSRDTVQITTNFDGSEILIFGAVKRDVAAPGPLDVIVTVAGPSLPVTVRRKDRRFGIWVNTEAVDVDAAPSFYSVSTTGPFDDILSDTEDLRHAISIPRAIRAVGVADQAEDAAAFTRALMRIRTNDGLYTLNQGAVELIDDTLFRTSVSLPANLTEGAYATRIFLMRDGAVVSHYDTDIRVEKVGLERWLFNLSRQQPLIYGLMSLAIAIAAGWGASAAFGLLRRG